MELSKDTATTGNIITHYDAHTITVLDNPIDYNFILTPTALLPWPLQSFADITLESLSTILEKKPAILLIGTGETHQHLPPALQAELMQQRIGVEVMTTAAACRTYNILAAENRDVMALFFL